MQAKALLFFCLQVLINEKTWAQCLGYGLANAQRHYARHIAREPAYDPAPPGTYSKRLVLDSFNVPGPVISIASDGLVIDGAVSVCGSLPFLGSVGVQGELPVCGAGSVQFSSSDSALFEMPERTSLVNPYSLFPFY